MQRRRRHLRNDLLCDTSERDRTRRQQSFAVSRRYATEHATDHTRGHVDNHFDMQDTKVPWLCHLLANWKPLPSHALTPRSRATQVHVKKCEKEPTTVEGHLDSTSSVAYVLLLGDFLSPTTVDGGVRNISNRHTRGRQRTISASCDRQPRFVQALRPAQSNPQEARY